MSIEVRLAERPGEYEQAAKLFAINNPWKGMGRIDIAHHVKKVSQDEADLIVAVEGKEVLGALVLEYYGQFRPFVRSLCVHEKCRGEHIGEKLIDAALKISYDFMGYMYLTCHDDVFEFYKRLGFEQVGYLTDLLEPGNNEYLMVKKKPA